MNDIKNVFLAWVSTGSPILAVISSESAVTVLSAIVLPVIFFAVGKTIDVLLQIRLNGRGTGSDKEKR